MGRPEKVTDHTGQRTRKFYGSGNGAENSVMESIRKYDSTGLLSGIIRRNREGILEQYEYDTMRRLTGVAQDGMILRTYSFDVYGNRKRVRDYTAGIGTGYNETPATAIVVQQIK